MTNGTDNTAKYLLIGGTILGGGALLYWFFKKSGSGDDDAYRRLIEELTILKAMTEEYMDEVNALLVAINNWADAGIITPEQQDILDQEMSTIKAKEQPIIIQFETTDDAACDWDESFEVPNPWEDMLGTLGMGVEIAVWGSLAIGALYGAGFVSTIVARAIKNWRDNSPNMPPPTHPLPTGEPITAPNMNAFAEEYLQGTLDLQIDTSTFAVAVPEAQAIYNTLPDWQQRIIWEETIYASALAGETGWNWAPNTNWLPQFQQNPYMAYYIVAGAAVAFVVIATMGSGAISVAPLVLV